MAFEKLFEVYPELATKLEQFKEFPVEFDQELAWAKQRRILAQTFSSLAHDLDKVGSFDLATQAYWQVTCIGGAVKKLAFTKRVKAPQNNKLELDEVSNKAELNFYKGLAYFWGIGCEQDSQRALDYFERAAQVNDANAQFFIGCMYQDGEGVAQDYAAAVRFYKLSAAQGHAKAQYRLGHMYEAGKDVREDQPTALHFYNLAAKQGDAAALASLGRLSEIGKGVPQDFARAVRFYSLAAEQGDTRIQLKLGDRYLEGEGVEQSYTAAAYWYRLGAARDVFLAKTNLQNIYLSHLKQLSLDVEQALAARRDITQGIEEAALHLERYGATHAFMARYHAAHGLDALFNPKIKPLMAEAPNEFCLALQADTELTDAERLKYSRMLAMQVGKALSSEQRNALECELVKLQMHVDVTQESQNYLRQIEAKYVADSAATHATTAPCVAEQKSDAFEVLKSKIILLHYFNIDNLQRLRAVAQLKACAKVLSQSTQLSAQAKYLALCNCVQATKETVQQDHAIKRYGILNFFKIATQSRLVTVLDEILLETKISNTIQRTMAPQFIS